MESGDGSDVEQGEDGGRVVSWPSASLLTSTLQAQVIVIILILINIIIIISTRILKAQDSHYP